MPRYFLGLALFFAHQLAAALLVLTDASLFLWRELLPGVQHTLAQSGNEMGFMQRIVRIAPFNDIFHIAEKDAAILVVDNAKNGSVVRFVLSGIVRCEPPDKQSYKRKKRGNKSEFLRHKCFKKAN